MSPLHRVRNHPLCKRSVRKDLPSPREAKDNCLSHKWDRPLRVSRTILPPDDGHRNNVRNGDPS